MIVDYETLCGAHSIIGNLISSIYCPPTKCHAIMYITIGRGVVNILSAFFLEYRPKGGVTILCVCVHF